MKEPFRFRFKFRTSAAALLTLLLAACGGGSGGAGGTVDDGVVVSQDEVRLICTVADEVTRKPVADVAITYEAGASTYKSSTDDLGICELILPASEVAGITYPAASAEKVGYEPQTILFWQFTGGKSYRQDVLLTPLATNVSIPVGGEVVMHFGDDAFGGASNSQFQKQSDGLELSFPISDWADQAKRGFTKATVYLDVKGWESRFCANLVSLVGDAGTVSLPGGDSPSDGSWAGGKQIPFEFQIAAVGTQSAAVRVTSGTCSGTADFDDFETNRIRVYFN